MITTNRLIMLCDCLAPVILTGCDLSDVLPAADEPTIVLPAGYQILVNGRNVPVQGFDDCPRQDNFRLSTPVNTGRDCIVEKNDSD
ncbi:hypothetical protein C6H68_23080 [Photorhabdus luminescens]|nr:hypothetical protein C6H68_23080 [Photorhabdus luminescens]